MIKNSNQSFSGLVEKYIGTAYDNVKIVADNIDDVIALAGIEDLDDIAAIVAHTTDLTNPHETSDANLVVTDVFTNDVSNTAHGFVPKAIDDVAQYLRSDGVWNDLDDEVTNNASVASNTAHRLESDKLVDFFNGTFVESFNALVISNGVDTVEVTLENADGTNNLTMRFSDGLSTLDTTPIISEPLNEGSDTSPEDNYVYILQSDKTKMTVSTAGWPSTEHIKIGYFFIQSAAYVDTANRGALINQNWNDHMMGTNGQGHMSHLAEVVRLGTGWHSGVLGTGGNGWVDITAVPGDIDNVYFESATGFAYQAHKHTIPAIDTSGTDWIHVVNDFTTKYKPIQNIAEALTDSQDVTMATNYFNLVFAIAANKTSTYSPLLMLLPSGSYAAEAAALADVDSYSSYDLPTAFTKESTTGMLVCRVTFRHEAANNGTWTYIDSTDLRGGVSGVGGSGGGGAALTSFPDNAFEIYDSATPSKIAQFEIGSLTGTKIFTYPDVTGTVYIIGQGLGIPASGQATNLTGTASGMTAGHVTNGVYTTDEGLGGEYLNPTNLALTYEPKKSTDDNYVTDVQWNYVNALPDITGNAGTVTSIANNSNNETVFPVFVDAQTGAQEIETDVGFTYNPSTGLITALRFAGGVDGILGANNPAAATITTALITALGANCNLTNFTLDNAKTVQFNSELDNESSGAADTIALDSAQKQKSTINQNTVLTITEPTSIGNWMYKLVVTGSTRTITWASTGSATFKWANGAEPTWIVGTHIIGIYFDGTDCYMATSLSFS